jgi:hypothetical protein
MRLVRPRFPGRTAAWEAAEVGSGCRQSSWTALKPYEAGSVTTDV